ncbi:2,3-dehydroadipyl-CoA hydratase [Pirellulimonas nuda]|uniref:2,3-dehydroadipyl-CoA hydratase n=1 Tax=Pirellulimonas nuda TaxID=2528009 RepID=A0A518DHD9_9BACT|nr:enoyl-CoA hydratase/isomerase family protein [Pirellulimonas nuda]QDU90890.1 2,3-dehydroadipyl-CoA hydratase [Pirellulimonas nuda]
MVAQNHSVEVRVDAELGTVLLNRPERRNALSRSMIYELREALFDLHQERRVRAVILTGAGEAFCAGRDLRELATATEDPQADQARWGEEVDELRELYLEMLRFPKPLVACVNGPALASGAGLVLACDIALAVESAVVGLPEARFGLVSGLVGPLLAFRIGAGAAARLMLTGEPCPAVEAMRLGIVHEVAADGQAARERSEQIGRQCALGSPEAVSLSKRLLIETIGEPMMSQLTGGAIAAAMARTTESAQEGLDAFLAGRPPEWK